jgi:hypothetical protein
MGEGVYGGGAPVLEPKFLIEYRVLTLLFSLNLFLDLVSVRWDNFIVDDEIVVIFMKFG